MSRFQLIPKFYQTDALPIVQDLAFPPFKIEHRYKGVYERAGFDVNYGQGPRIRNGSRSGSQLSLPLSMRESQQSLRFDSSSDSQQTSPLSDVFDGKNVKGLTVGVDNSMPRDPRKMAPYIKSPSSPLSPTVSLSQRPPFASSGGGAYDNYDHSAFPSAYQETKSKYKNFSDANGGFHEGAVDSSYAYLEGPTRDPPVPTGNDVSGSQPVFPHERYHQLMEEPLPSPSPVKLRQPSNPYSPAMQHRPQMDAPPSPPQEEPSSPQFVPVTEKMRQRQSQEKLLRQNTLSKKRSIKKINQIDLALSGLRSDVASHRSLSLSHPRLSIVRAPTSPLPPPPLPTMKLPPQQDYSQFLSTKPLENQYRQSQVLMVSLILLRGLNNLFEDDDIETEVLQRQLDELKVTGGLNLNIELPNTRRRTLLKLARDNDIDVTALLSPEVSPTKEKPSIMVEQFEQVTTRQPVPPSEGRGRVGLDDEFEPQPHNSIVVQEPIQQQLVYDEEVEIRDTNIDHSALEEKPQVEHQELAGNEESYHHPHQDTQQIDLNLDTNDNIEPALIPPPLVSMNSQSLFNDDLPEPPTSASSSSFNFAPAVPEPITRKKVEVISPPSLEPLLATMPTFSIEPPNASPVSSTNLERSLNASISELSSLNKSLMVRLLLTTDYDDLLLMALYELVQPLFVKQEDVKFVLSPTLGNTFANDDILDTPDSPVPPLVPKKRSVKINDQLGQSPDRPNFPSPELKPTKLILKKTPGFESQGVHQVEYPEFEFGADLSPLMPIRSNNPAGSGPCRRCHMEVDRTAKGDQRAIFSKLGEMLGQWHRKCFQCSHGECQVAFSKHVQCYVFNDAPYCSFHYHQVNNTLCEFCSIGIEGECIENELQQKWHLHCLRCAKCTVHIREDYYLVNGDIYCEADGKAVILGLALSTTDKIEKRRTRLLYVDGQTLA